MFTKLFKREGKMEGTADVLEQLEEEDRLKRQQQAEQIVRENRAAEEFQARVTAAANDRLARTYNTLDEIGDLIPRLWLACSGLIGNVAEINREGLGYGQPSLIEDTLCVPVDFGEKMLAAIKDAAPNAAWDFSATGPLGKGKKAERPKLKGPLTIKVPRFPGDNAAPPGFVGAWDPIHGRPFVESEGTSAMFLPPAS